MSISGFIKKTFKVNPGKKMFSFILKKASLQNIRICISGGGPLAPSTFKHFNQLGIDFVQGYGLTEASPMIALNPVESQGWCVLGGAGATGKYAGRAKQALESVHQHLYTKNGIVLQQPAYAKYQLNLGEVTSYPPGVKENAGIFCHNNTWIHLAWCLMGDGDRALEYYLSICPSAKQDQIETYRSEPYVYAQMLAGKDASCFGEAKNSWLTGTAAWTFVSVSQGILGIKPQFDGLKIEPCIPGSWDGYSVQREFRGSTYQIKVENPNGVCTGVKKLVVDGAEVAGDVIPTFDDNREHNVTVTLG